MSDEFNQLLDDEYFIQIINKYIYLDVIEMHFYKSDIYMDGITIRIRTTNYEFYNFYDVKTNKFKKLISYNLVDILPEFKIYARKKKIENL